MTLAVAKKIWAATTLAVFSCFCATSHAQNVIDGFNPDPDGNIYTFAVQSDGRILLGGNFSHIGNQARSALARLNPDGSLDTAFNAGVASGGTVESIALQTDGRILIGGYFSQVGAANANSIARLNSDGSIDSSFAASVDPPGDVQVIVPEPNGSILVGGNLASVDNGYFACGLARYNANGSVDTSFSVSGLNNCYVSSLVVQADGHIVAGGIFSQNTTRLVAVRLSASGALDPSFQFTVLGNNAVVDALVQQPDGKILIGGGFDQADGSAQDNFARVNADGTLDQSFNSFGVDNEVENVLLEPDGNIVIGGEFTHAAGLARAALATFDWNGNVQNFNANLASASPGPSINALAFQSDNELLIAGYFNALGSVTRNGIARIGTNAGVLDDTLSLALNPGNNGVMAIAAQVDGNLLVGGDFTSIGPTTRNRLMRILADGTVGQNYDPNADQFVDAIAVAPDGSSYVGGAFNHIGGTSQAILAHLTFAGAVDAGFAPAVTHGFVTGIALQPNGQILINGTFTNVNGASHPGFARVNPDGSVDNSFNVVANDSVFAMALQADGRIVIGGTFNMIGSTAVPSLVRVNANGTLDSSFDGTTNGLIYAALVETDGRILIAGNYSRVHGQICPVLARLNADGSLNQCFPVTIDQPPLGILELTNGKILITGTFTEVNGFAHSGIARLNDDGSLDDTFEDVDQDGRIYAAAVARDGKVVIGGSFANAGGRPRQYMARLSLAEAAQQSLGVNGNTVTWLRSGDGLMPALPPTLLYSSDDNNFVSLGSMTPIFGGWQYSGLNPPVGQLYFLRAQAPALSAFYESPGDSVLQYTSEFFLNDEIFKNGFQ